MLLWFLKDQRVYLHNVLFLACFNWEFFSRCKDSWHHVIKPMYKIAFVIFRHLILARGPLPQYRSVTWEYGTFSSLWSLWRNLVHHKEHVLYAFSHAHLMIVELNQEEKTVRRTLVRNSAPHTVTWGWTNAYWSWKLTLNLLIIRV